jgi:hypothetical protein
MTGHELTGFDHCQGSQFRGIPVNRKEWLKANENDAHRWATSKLVRFRGNFS